MQKLVNGFPSDFISEEEKSTPKYALDWARGIWNDADKGYSGQLGSQVNRFVELRRRAGGFTPIEDFKSIIASQGSTAWLNINWAVNDPIKSIVQELVGGFTNREYKPQCETIDQEAVTEYKEKRNELLFKKTKAQLNDQYKEITGHSLIDEDDTEVFESVEEIDLHMAMNVKSSTALGMELLMENVLKSNKKEKLIKKIYTDLVVLGKAGVKVYYDEDYNIKWRHIDPINLVTSFAKEEDFSDIKYAGEIIQVTVSQLAETGEFSEEQLFEIAKNSSAKWGNPDWQNGWGKKYHAESFESGAPYKSFKVKVMDCQWITTNYQTYSSKKTNGKSFFKKEYFKYEQSPTARVNKQIYKKKFQAVYKSKWVIDTDYVYDYGRRKSEPHKRVNGKILGETDLDFVIYQPDMYDMDSKSLVELIIPYADQMCLIQLKMQQFYAQARPSGSAIDTAGLTHLVKGMGDLASSAADIKALYDQTGDLWYSSVDDSGKFIGNQKPIQPLAPDLTPLDSFIRTHEYYKSLIRDIIGIAQSRSPVMMDKKVAVGEAEMALNASYNATRFIETSFKEIFKKGSEITSIMIQDSIKYHNKKDQFKMIVGSSFVDSIEVVDRIPLCEFGTYIYISPDSKEKMFLEQNIQQALAQKLIKQSDALVLRRIGESNPELAERYMNVFERRYEKERQEAQIRPAQEQAKSQAELADYQEAAKQKTLQAEWQLKEMYMMKEYDRKRELLELELSGKMRETLIEGEQKIEQIDKAGEIQQGQMKEDSNKDEAIAGSIPKATGIRQPKIPQGGVSMP